MGKEGTEGEGRGEAVIGLPCKAGVGVVHGFL